MSIVFFSMLVAPVLAQDLWKYAGSGVDAILFFNTKQAENSMDKDLWDTIQQDKKNALAQEKESVAEEGLGFDMKDRHAEGLVNVRIEGTNPTRLSLDGAIKLTGFAQTTPLEDLKSLLNTKLQGEGIEQQKLDIEGKEAFRIKTKINGNGQPMEILIIPRDDNTFEFKTKLNGQEGTSLGFVAQNGSNASLVQGISGSDVSLAFACQTNRLASLIKSEDARMNMLKAWLMATSTGNIVVRVEEKKIKLTLHITFLNTDMAQQLYANVNPKLALFASIPEISTFLSSINMNVTGGLLTVNASLDIEKGWSMVRMFDYMPVIENDADDESDEDIEKKEAAE